MTTTQPMAHAIADNHARELHRFARAVQTMVGDCKVIRLFEGKPDGDAKILWLQIPYRDIGTGETWEQALEQARRFIKK